RQHRSGGYPCSACDTCAGTLSQINAVTNRSISSFIRMPRLLVSHRSQRSVRINAPSIPSSHLHPPPRAKRAAGPVDVGETVGIQFDQTGVHVVPRIAVRSPDIECVPSLNGVRHEETEF